VQLLAGSQEGERELHSETPQLFEDVERPRDDRSWHESRTEVMKPEFEAVFEGNEKNGGINLRKNFGWKEYFDWN